MEESSRQRAVKATREPAENCTISTLLITIERPADTGQSTTVGSAKATKKGGVFESQPPFFLSECDAPVAPTVYRKRKGGSVTPPRPCNQLRIGVLAN